MKHQSILGLGVEVTSVLLVCFWTQVWRSAGRLDVSVKRRDLSSSEAADLLHQLREVSVGGEHQPHEEAGLGCHTEKDDHYQVDWAGLKLRFCFFLT